jgi:hypothetical protein
MPMLVVGTFVTIGSAIVGYTGLADRLLRVDELDASRPSRRLDGSLKGPLFALTAGQEAEIRYRVAGCFSSIDRIVTFTRGEHGLMSARIVDGSSAVYGAPAVYQRALTPVELAAIDLELAHVRSAAGGCTQREEFDIVVRDQSRELGRSHFIDESCDRPIPRGAISLSTLVREGLSDR